MEETTNSEKIDKPVTAKPLSEESTEEKVPVKKKAQAPSTNGSSESVMLDIKLDDKPKNAQIPFNFKTGKFTSDFVKTKTEGELITPTDSPAPSNSTSSSTSSAKPSSYKPKETPAEIRATMLSEEEADGNKQATEDFEDTADMIIDLVDFAVVFLIRTISLDTSDAPYQPSTDRVNKLKKHLTRYLIRQNKSFPMGFLMIMAIVGAYGTPMRKAIEHRSLVTREKAKKKKEESSDNNSGNPLKKRPGRQPK